MKQWIYFSIVPPLLLLLTSSQASVLRRDKRSLSNTDIDDVIAMLGPQQEVDLVLLVDRSRGMQMDTFYLRELRLLERIVRQYAAVSEKYVRIAGVTFAVDVELVFNSISDQHSPFISSINKAHLFSGNAPLWSDMLYYHDDARFADTDIERGFKLALEIFTAGR